MSEEWRPVAGVLVSSEGRVRTEAGAIVRQHPSHNGYLRVRVGGAWRRVSHLVLEAFAGPRPSPRHVAAHAPDRSLRNNRADNLAWKLPDANERDKREHGTHRGGGRHRRPSRRRVRVIRALADFGVSFTRIAAIERLHRSSVSRIARRVRRRDA